jgi:hypothetical protein
MASTAVGLSSVYQALLAMCGQGPISVWLDAGARKVLGLGEVGSQRTRERLTCKAGKGALYLPSNSP